MSRQIEPHRLDLVNYPFHWEVYPTFGDSDLAGHINNVALVRYYETGRTRWLLDATANPDIFRGGAFNTVVAEYRVRFIAEVNFPHQVTTATGLGHIGNSSFSCQQALFQNGRCVGLNDAVMVVVSGGKPIKIEGELRAQMAAYLIHQP
jgi:acyl-CoA thioester hydrolase